MVRCLEFECKNAKTFYRILPMPKMCWENIKILDDKKTIYVRYLQELGASKKVEKPSYWCFNTDGIFYNNTQAQIYEQVVPELLENVVKGYNGLLCCFGQTGTGKSLTTIGVENSYEDRGIIPRLISQLFVIKNELKSKFKICLKLSYIEATKTHIRDLLKDEETNFDIHKMKEVSVPVCQTEQEMLKAVYTAEGRKTLSKNNFYPSHSANSVLTITVVSRHLNHSSLPKTYSKIHIVDLAGADTVGNKTSIDKNVFDLATGNLAKTQLEQFLLVLIENIPEQVVVKQRLNILINYLKDGLNESSLLRFIGHIRVDDVNLPITLSMLRFGQVARKLKPKKMYLNSYEDDSAKIRYLQDELKSYKVQKEIDSMIRNEDMKSTLTFARLYQLENLAVDYLKNKIDELTVANIADFTTALQVFKKLYQQLENEKGPMFDGGGYKKGVEAYDSTSMRSSAKSVFSQKSFRRASARSRDTMVSSSSRVAKERVSSKIFTNKRGTPKNMPKGADIDQSASPSTKLDSLNNTSRSKESVHETTGKTLRRSRTSTGKIMRKSSSSRRRGSIDSQKEKVFEDLPLPDTLPSPSDAWRSFVASEAHNYEEMKKELDEYEREAHILNGRYIEDLKKLQDLRAWLDLCREKRSAVRMQRELTSRNERDESGNPILSEQELACNDMISNGERQLVQQQEAILTLQSELKLYLQFYREKKKKIDESFEAFCSETYKTLVPELEEAEKSEMTVLSYDYETKSGDRTTLLTRESVTAVKEDMKVAEQQARVREYEKLRLLAQKQREKVLHDQALKRKWIRSCKN